MILQETDRTLIEHTPEGLVKKTYKKLSVERFLEITSHIYSAPHIVSITASTDETSFVMEHIPYTLTEYVKLFPSEKLCLVQKIAIKLFKLWERGTVHGDFHANNILVDKTGEPFFIDFERCYNVMSGIPFSSSPDLIGPTSAFWNKGQEVDLNTILGVNSSQVIEFVRQYLINDIKSSGGAYWENASEGQIYGSYNLQDFKVDGRRNAENRLKQFDISMSDKTVLDLGCNAGSICFEAVNQGAKSVHGVEQMESRVVTAQRIAAFTGYNAKIKFSVFNFDFDDINTIGTANIVCAFAIDHQTKNADQLYKNLFNLTEETLLFESSRQPQYREWCRTQLLNAGFNSVEYIGESSASDKNHRSRMLYVARKI